MKIQVSNLIIEVTRKCNMSCEHCLRGDIQSMNLPKNYVDSLLEQIDYICMLTFTGGEPSLNVEIIDYFLEQCKRRKIGIGSFYIATNGLKIKEDFVMSCLRLFSYSDEKEMCRVDVSNDMYHQSEGSYNTELLDGLTFFGRKFDVEGFSYYNGETVIREGRGENIGNRELSYDDVETVDGFNDTDIYLNCNGDIVNGCDLSYINQDNYILCRVEKLTEFVEGLDD